MRDVVRPAADFPGLFRRLETLVENEAGSPLSASGRSALESGITKAIMVHAGTKFATELKSRFTLHGIAEPLARVIALLEDEANRDAVLVALGAPEWLAIRGRFSVDPTGTPTHPTPTGDPAERRAAAGHRRLLADLRAIARAVPKQPEGRKKGRPPTAESFHDFIDRLATCWERASGTSFRSVNRPAQFVHAVVDFVDPLRPKESTTYMIKLVVSERLAQISEK
jgi:hypothetical protein